MGYGTRDLQHDLSKFAEWLAAELEGGRRAVIVQRRGAYCAGRSVAEAFFVAIALTKVNPTQRRPQGNRATQTPMHPRPPYTHSCPARPTGVSRLAPCPAFPHLLQACDVQCRSASLATTSQLTAYPSDAFLATQYKEMMGSRDRAYDGRLEWPAMVRKLNREHPLYAQ